MLSPSTTCSVPNIRIITASSLQEIRDAFARDIAYKQEATALLDEIAAIAARSQAPTRNVAISAMRGRIAKLEAQWQELGQEIDENLSCLKKEQRKCAESAVRQQTQLVDDLRKALAASYEATDAEELSECLDVRRPLPPCPHVWLPHIFFLGAGEAPRATVLVGRAAVAAHRTELAGEQPEGRRCAAGSAQRGSSREGA